MAPKFRTHIHTDAKWELISSKDYKQHSSDDINLSYRLLWRSSQIHVPTGLHDSMQIIKEAKEYIYLLVTADDWRKVHGLAAELRNLISQNVALGIVPSTVDYQCTDPLCSFIIHLQSFPMDDDAA